MLKANCDKATNTNEEKPVKPKKKVVRGKNIINNKEDTKLKQKKVTDEQDFHLMSNEEKSISLLKSLKELISKVNSLDKNSSSHDRGHSAKTHPMLPSPPIKEYIGFCPMCGDAALTPTMINYTLPNFQSIYLSISCCKKCGCMVTRINEFESFIIMLLKFFGIECSKL